MTDRQRKWYEDKLAAFAASHGARYELVTGMTYAAAACGLSQDEVIEDCRTRMSDFRAEHAANIRRGLASAYTKISSHPATGEHKTTAPLHGFPDKVKELIRAGGMKADMDALPNLSPQCVSFDHRGKQTMAFLQSLWNPSDLLHIERSDRHEQAAMGEHLRPCREWIEVLKRQPLPGDIIGRNPYSGETGETGEGKPSLTASSCVASFRYALVEFDALPIKEQAAFWLGFLRTMPKLAPFLSALTYSGGKSIHGLLRVNADRISAPKVTQALRRLFCTDPEKHTRRDMDGRETEAHPFRADPMGFGMRGNTRLAGARRIGSGAIQRLLFLRQPA